jgi:hypothetical protein
MAGSPRCGDALAVATEDQVVRAPWISTQSAWSIVVPRSTHGTHIQPRRDCQRQRELRGDEATVQIALTGLGPASVSARVRVPAVRGRGRMGLVVGDANVVQPIREHVAQRVTAPGADLTRRQNSEPEAARRYRRRRPSVFDDHHAVHARRQSRCATISVVGRDERAWACGRTIAPNRGAVASSRIRICGCLMTARAIARRWRWPPES